MTEIQGQQMSGEQLRELMKQSQIVQNGIPTQQQQPVTTQNVTVPVNTDVQQPVFQQQSLTEEELSQRLSQNVVANSPSEEGPVKVSPVQSGSMERAEQYLDNMAQDFKESYEIRKKLAEDGINPQIIGNFDPSKEALAPEEDKKRALEAKAAANTAKEYAQDVREKTEEEQEKEINDKHNEGMIVIEKMGDGYLDFTQEEHEKMAKAKKIRVDEVEEVSLDMLKTKKKKVLSADKIISLKRSAFDFSVPLPVSGYIAVMKGLSTQQLQNLWGEDDDNNLRATTRKWRILYDCMVDSSIGKMTFEDFLKNTSAFDFEMLVFGALVATYPEDDKIDLVCPNPKCNKQHEHKYSLRSLIRAERFSDDLKERLLAIIEASSSKEAAKETHEGSLVKTTKSIRLPESGIIFTLYTQSAYEFINISVKEISQIDDPAYNQSSVYATAVKSVHVLDPEDEGSYLEYTETEDLIKFIYNLGDKDSIILTDQIGKIITNRSIDFGFMNVKCPHCGEYHQTMNVQLNDILFHRSQELLATTVE